MRLSRTAIITIFAVSICLISLQPSYASVVTIDVAAKTAKSDVTTLEMFALQVSRQQAGLCVNNKIMEPQQFTLRYSGLTEADYDLYVNGASKGSRSLQQLQQGLQLQVDGSVCDPGMMRCLSSVSPGLQKLYDLLRQSKVSEEQYVLDTMRQAILWATVSLSQEQGWRSIRVIIAPKGRALDTTEWSMRKSDYDTAATITNTCWLLQQARDQMYHQVKDPSMRNDAVIALTPVEFSAGYSVKNGKPHISAKLLNNCDLPLSGTLSVGLPAGWKTTGAKLKFSQLKSGQTFSLSCDLVTPSKSAVAPQEVPITANVTVTQLDKSASMKLSATAKATPK